MTHTCITDPCKLGGLWWHADTKGMTLGKKRPDMKKTMLDNGNPNWIGNRVRYYGLHSYMRRRLPKPEFCQECGTRKACDMANVSGKYLRDLSDWRYLCRRCHMKGDGRFKNLKQFRGGE